MSGSRVVALSLRATTLALIRGGLAAAGLAACLLIADDAGPPILAFAVGAALIAILILGDPRRRPPADTEPLPPHAVRDSWIDVARTDVFPSTVTVGVLMWVLVAFDAVLASFLAGIEAGMGLMAGIGLMQVTLAERRRGQRLFAERGTNRRFAGG